MTEPYGALPSYPGGPGSSAPLYGAPLATRARNGMGTAALVLGIVSIFPLALLVVPAVLGIVFGVIGRRRVRRREATNGGFALTGIICGVVGLLLGIAGWIAIIYVANDPSFPRYQDCQRAAVTQADKDQCARDFSRDLMGS